MTISSIVVSGSTFSISGITLPLNLGAGKSHTFKITFAPTAAGVDSETLTISSDATDPTVTIPISGTGEAAKVTGTPALALSPSSLSFGNVNMGTTTTQSVSLSNSGSGSLVISQPTVSGTGFGISGLSFPVTLTAGQSASMTASFDPAAAGSISGSILISSNASVTAATVALTGTGVNPGVPVLAFSPASISFGSVNVGTKTTTDSLAVQLRYCRVDHQQRGVSGTGYTISALARPLTLNAGQSTSLTVSYDPAAAGSNSGTVSITSTSDATDP